MTCHSRLPGNAAFICAAMLLRWQFETIAVAQGSPAKVAFVVSLSPASLRTQCHAKGQQYHADLQTARDMLSKSKITEALEILNVLPAVLQKKMIHGHGIVDLAVEKGDDVAFNWSLALLRF